MFRLSRAPSSNRRRPDILPRPLLHAASTPSTTHSHAPDRARAAVLPCHAAPLSSSPSSRMLICDALHEARTRKSLSHFLLLVLQPIPNLPHTCSFWSHLVPHRPVFCFLFPAALLRIPRPTSTSPLLPFGVQRKSTSAHLHPDSCWIGPKSNPSCPPSLCSARNPNQCTWYGHQDREGALRAASTCASPANTEAGPSVASEQSYTCVLARPCCVPHSSRARAKGGGIAAEQA
ncbi:hypothetical protein JOL62DRAFT_566297, partial [Phyllosticta paracitricarpa]